MICFLPMEQKVVPLFANGTKSRKSAFCQWNKKSYICFLPTIYILSESPKVLARSTVQHITATEQLDENMKKRMEAFQNHLAQRLGETGFVINNLFETKNILQDEDLIDDPAYGDGSNTPTDEEYRFDKAPPDRVEEDELATDAYDKFIGAEMTVDFGTEGRKRATVKERVRDFDGNFVGRSNPNPLLDTSMTMVHQTKCLPTQSQRICIYTDRRRRLSFPLA
jgi:hypothetical protein